MLYDKDMRDPICDFLEDRFGKLRIFDEIEIGKARADLVMVRDNALTGIEIKSNMDTYERLAGQVKYYDKYFDLNYIAVGTRHLKHVAEHVPAYWGIIAVSSEEAKTCVSMIRPALEHKKTATFMMNQLSLLWKLELYNILDNHHLPGYRQKSKRFICEALISKLNEAELKEALCEELFQRDYTIFEDEKN